MDYPAILAELDSGDDSRAEAAAQALADLSLEDQAHALDVLESRYREGDANQRWWAIRAIAEITDQRVESLLLSAIEDEDPQVRQCALLGLRLVPSRDGVRALTRLLSDSSPLTADLARHALQSVGEPAVPALLEVLEDGAPAARLRALRALAEIGDERATQALFEALGGDSALMEYWAEQGLEKMGIGMVYFKP